jgi:CRP/FNR family transcriptional regulator, nitrogen oxide reductase regulator
MPHEIAFTVESGQDSCNSTGASSYGQVLQVSPIALLAGMSPGECREILSLATLSSFVPDETLFLEGQHSNSLILIRSGKVKLIRSDRSGGEVIVRICGPGEIVDADVYDDTGSGRHRSTARTMTHCSALIWDSKQAFALGVRHQQIRTNIIKILANRLDELEERYCEFSTDKCGRRLARTLLRCVDSEERTNHGAARVALSRGELAQMIGVTVFTISRTLSRWADTGIISRGRDAIIIHRPGELRTLLEEDV